MTTFVRGRTVTTSDALVVVDAGLAVGIHRFQLVVVSNDGRQSAPDMVDVVVAREVVIPVPVRPPVTRPPVIPVVPPTGDPVGTRIRTPAKPRKTRARKPAKSRSET